MEKPMCQSCTMPMTNEDFGTHQDGSPNSDYCKYCYANGAFTSEMSMQEMIDVCVPYMATPESGLTEKDAREMLNKSLPELKRWKKHNTGGA